MSSEKPKLVSLDGKRREAVPEVVAEIEGLLEKAKAGEVREYALVYTYLKDDGNEGSRFSKNVRSPRAAIEIVYFMRELEFELRAEVAETFTDAAPLDDDDDDDDGGDK